MNIRKLAYCAMLSAISILLANYVQFSIFPAAPYLKYEPSDVPILIAGFMFGPLAGLAITVLTSAIMGMTVGAQDGLFGIFMHILATGTLVTTASLIYAGTKNKSNAIYGMLTGTIAMAAVMAGANYFLSPIFYGMPREAVAEMLIPFIIPFNLIKASANSLITLIIYKRVAHFGERAILQR